MAMRDEIKEQRKKTSDMTRKKRFAYFWDYYHKAVIIGSLSLAVFIILMVDAISNNKESLFELAIINSETTSVSETFVNDFSAYLELDPDKQRVTLDNSFGINLDAADQLTVASSQKLMGLIQVGDLDAMLSTYDIIDYYCRNGVLADLHTILPTEQVTALEEQERLYYAANDAGSKIPVGIKVDNSKRLQDAALYQFGQPILSFSITSEHLDASRAFLAYLYE